MLKILVTGANGFVGAALISRLILALPNRKVRACARRSSACLPSDVDSVLVEEITGNTDWQAALNGVDVVIHTAARVHVMSDKAADPLSEFRKVNTEGALNLARCAAACGVKRFIFISSVKVNGESTTASAPFHADDNPHPVDPYGISKAEAEYGLKEICSASDMEFVIIRSPLVYGPGVKANFLNMMKWVYRGMPLPLGAINNKRSFVSVYNLIDLIVHCIDHPKAANQIFFVSDGEDLSTTELLLRVGRALGVPARLIPIPENWIMKGASVIGRRAVVQRLCGDLQVDMAKTCELLDWRPPVSIDEAMRKTARAFKEEFWNGR